jgi:hypothetical protein
VEVLRRYALEKPSPEVDQNLRVAKQWLALLVRGCSSADAENLIQSADSLPIIGAVSLDLQLGASHWARAQLGGSA